MRCSETNRKCPMHKAGSVGLCEATNEGYKWVQAFSGLVLLGEETCHVSSLVLRGQPRPPPPLRALAAHCKPLRRCFLEDLLPRNPPFFLSPKSIWVARLFWRIPFSGCLQGNPKGGRPTNLTSKSTLDEPRNLFGPPSSVCEPGIRAMVWHNFSVDPFLAVWKMETKRKQPILSSHLKNSTCRGFSKLQTPVRMD